MDHPAAFFLTITVAFIFGLVGGCVVKEASFASDCKKIGAHVTSGSGTVIECRPRQKPE